MHRRDFQLHKLHILHHERQTVKGKLHTRDHVYTCTYLCPRWPSTCSYMEVENIDKKWSRHWAHTHTCTHLHLWRGRVFRKYREPFIVTASRHRKPAGMCTEGVYKCSCHVSKTSITSQQTRYICSRWHLHLGECVVQRTQAGCRPLPDSPPPTGHSERGLGGQGKVTPGSRGWTAGLETGRAGSHSCEWQPVRWVQETGLAPTGHLQLLHTSPLPSSRSLHLPHDLH